MTINVPAASEPNMILPLPDVEPQETPVVYRTFNEQMSDEIGELAAGLAKAQGEMMNGAKSKQGYSYKYMELGALIEIARPALSKHGVAIIQTHELIKGKAPSVVTHTTVMHESGQWHKSSIELPIKTMPQLSPAQMIGVNCTYGRRYALQAICLIASEDDTDGKAI
jgi:hypothetical protein